MIDDTEARLETGMSEADLEAVRALQEADAPKTGKGRKAPPIRRAGRPGSARLRAPVREPVREAPRDASPQGKRLVRKRRIDDPFHFNPRIIPDGVSYEWKRMSVYGQQDPEHQVNLRENHWRPVPASRHPELMPDGYDKQGAITRKGMVLMERPAYLTQEARQEDYEIARAEVSRKEQQLGSTPAGTMTRQHPSVERQMMLRKEHAPLHFEE